MNVQDTKLGIWKSGKGRGRHTPKGRQLDDGAQSEVIELIGNRPLHRDLLIEFFASHSGRLWTSFCCPPSCISGRDAYFYGGSLGGSDILCAL